MRSSTALLAILASGANAFPAVMKLMARDVAQPGCTTSKLCDTYLDITDEEAGIPKTDTPAITASKARGNCGISPCTTFNAQEQYRSTTGDHAFIAPGPNDIRGPCPGLNAAANHGYISRTGVQDIVTFATNLDDLYGLTTDFGIFLAAYSIALDGDVASLLWTIGGPSSATLGGLLGAGEGLSYSHNNYEGDTSITRCDAYTNGGDAHASSMTRFRYAYESGMDDDRYTLDKFARLYTKNTFRSIQQNALYFAPPFSTTAVSPAAYDFVIVFMSNHTAENPEGYLNGDIFKSFFAVTGDYPNFVWNKGMERIPDNWYRRAIGSGYGAVPTVAELVPTFAAYPNSFRLGGNTNGTNTYTGVDLTDLTGGVYNADSLLEGNNFACFIVEAFQAGLPDALNTGINDIGAATELVTKYFPQEFLDLSCPAIAKYDPSVFDKYTGHDYHPSAPVVGAKNC